MVLLERLFQDLSYDIWKHIYIILSSELLLYEVSVKLNLTYLINFPDIDIVSQNSYFHFLSSS